MKLSTFAILLIVLLCLAALFFILSIVYRRICRKVIGSLEYKREFSSFGVYEGDSVTLYETVYNNSRFPLLSIYAESYLYPELQLTAYTYKDKKAMQLFQSKFTLIMPYMQVKRKHKIICQKRGKYQLESAEIILPGSSRYIDSPSRIYVYPKILPAPTNPYPVGILMGESVSKRMMIKNPFSISGVRQYSFGDPFNQINFKATAKAYATAAEPLRVNNLEYCSNRTFKVFINFQTHPREPIPSAIFTRMMENAMSYTADIIRVMTENGYRLGLSCNCILNDGTTSLNFPIHSGELHAREMLCGMSEVRIASSLSFSNLLNRDVEAQLCDTEIFIFTAYVDEETETAVQALRQGRNSVNLIILSQEEESEDAENTKASKA